jgi:SagB-type dehydrogenase family enzyme
MFRKLYPAAWAFYYNTIVRRHHRGSPPSAVAVPPFKEYLDVPLVPLPVPGKLKTSLGVAIRNRFSCRQFLDRPLPMRILSTLLHAGYGIQGPVVLGEHELLTRPVPSGGGLYPLEIYLLARQVGGLDPGIYHYAAIDHALERLSGEQLPASRLRELFLGQTYASDAPLIVVLTAVLGRALGKYADRGLRLILLEAGHVAQNLNLTATALGWGSVNLGGFFDLELGAALNLDSDLEVPVYAIAVGKPRQADVDVLRQP